MGAELAREFPAAREAFNEADEALGFTLSKLCFEGPEEDLRLTANTQPATLATSIAALRAFTTEYGVQAEIAAGHSLGEYSALVAAGALEFAAALRAVRERGRLMQEACPAGQGSMAALIGLDLAAVREVCEQVSRRRPDRGARESQRAGPDRDRRACRGRQARDRNCQGAWRRSVGRAESQRAVSFAPDAAGARRDGAGDRGATGDARFASE